MYYKKKIDKKQSKNIRISLLKFNNLKINQSTRVLQLVWVDGGIQSCLNKLNWEIWT